MKKLLMLAVLFSGAVLAQDATVPVLDAATLPLPASWKENAFVVILVNSFLAMLALAIKMIPGKLGEIIAKLVDVASANISHEKKK